MMKSTYLSMSLILVFTLFYSCSDDDNNDNGTDGGNSPDLKTGVFLDGAVQNIGYRTLTENNGVTNEKGEYNYVAGEDVTFFIGNLELPTVTAKEIVTPLDMSNITELGNNQKVINIIRLLQTLDKDGNPDNGIEITPVAIEKANELNLDVFDFDIPTTDFENDNTINEFIKGAGQDTPLTTLVSEENAINHFQETLNELNIPDGLNNEEELEFVASDLVGKTYFFDFGDNDSNETTFNADGTSIHCNDTSTGVSTFEWKVEDGKLIVMGPEGDNFIDTYTLIAEGQFSLTYVDGDESGTLNGTFNEKTDLDFIASEFSGKTYLFDFEDGSERITFNANGIATYLDDGPLLNAEWKVEDGKIIISGPEDDNFIDTFTLISNCYCSLSYVDGEESGTLNATYREVDLNE